MSSPYPDLAQFDTPEFKRYVEAHKHPNGEGDGRPTAFQIIKDEGLEGKLTYRTFLITGCSAGLGLEAARVLKTTGARLFVTARNLDKGREALGDILEPGKVDLLHLELGPFASVRKCAAEFLEASGGKLNILISKSIIHLACFLDNAGVMRTPFGLTPSGFETQFGTNHLGHFLLFQLLLPTLLSSSTPSFQSRVISVSSLGHRHHPPTPQNWNLTDCYDASQAYSNSKIANIWFASEVERRYGQHGLHALSVYPGGVFTGLAVNMSEDELQGWKKYPVVMAYMKNAAQGAATEVWAAVAKCLEGRGGVYVEDCQVSQPVRKGYGAVDTGFEKWAYDESGERELWERSFEWVGVGEE